MNEGEKCGVEGCMVHAYVMDLISEMKERQSRMEDHISILTESNIRLEESHKTAVKLLEKLEARDEDQDKVINANKIFIVKLGSIIGFLAFLATLAASFFGN